MRRSELIAALNRFSDRAGDDPEVYVEVNGDYDEYAGFADHVEKIDDRCVIIAYSDQRAKSDHDSARKEAVII